MGLARGNKEKILLCARELFYHGGYQATSVDDILARCGVSKSNFYYHFKTKETLGFAVIELHVTELEDMILRSLRNAALSPPERLSAFFGLICQVQGEILAGCPFGNLAASLPNTEGDERAERFRVRLSQLFHNLEAALRVCLAEGTRVGAFRTDVAPSEMAAFLVATLEGLLILAKTHRDMAPLISGFAVVERLLRVR